MGGAIAVIFSDRRPAMVRKLGLIDPAGFPPKRSFVTRLGKAPILGELLICLHYRPKKFQEELRVQMQYKGFERALLSTVRHGPLGDLSETYKRVGEQERPALLIWRREDQAIPIGTNKKVRETIPHIEFHAIDGAGHAPHQDRPEEVNPLLIALLKKGQS